MKRLLGCLFVIAMLVTPPWLEAREAPTTTPTTAPATQPATSPSPLKPEPGDRLSTTEHETTIAGQPIRYRATAGTTQLKDADGKPRADLFHVVYERLPLDPDRPITFVFNGGPGAASVWLHLGTIGPVRVALQDDGTAGPPPYRFVPNHESWLDATDLVFIDPVGTGYSRATEGQKPEQFWGVDQDGLAVSDFIRLHITRTNRWQSPKFLAGESYGTTRAALISDVLARRFGIAVNGVMLISTVLDFSTLRPDVTNDLPYALYLPTYAAVAWYHQRLAPDLQNQPMVEVIRAAERFAIEEYLPALAKGSQLPPERRAQVLQQVARFTAMDPQFLDRAQLRIDPGQFRKRLLEHERQVVGRFDGRVTGYDPDPVGGPSWVDPSYDQYKNAYTAAMHAFVREELKFESNLFYEVLASVGPWDYGRESSATLYVGDNLRTAMLNNPHLRVLIASGWFDLATPHFAADTTFHKMDLPPSLRQNLVFRYYDGGHMMYHVPAAREQLRRDAVEFINASVPKR
jgi:carboxypeptidase C (cathepsin A)